MGSYGIAWDYCGSCVALDIGSMWEKWMMVRLGYGWLWHYGFCHDP